MGKYDEVIYHYLSEEQRFADLFNASCFQGKLMVDAGKLRRLVERIQTKVSDEEKRKSIYRDIRMQLPEGTKFIILTVENQMLVDYEMPWRIMRYDCVEYENQINEIHRKKREEFQKQHANEAKKASNRKLMEKMNEADRLYPVYTICFYHGSEPWTGPRSLKEMMDFGEIGESWQNLFSDYRIIFVDAEDPQLAERCRTDLKLLLNVLRLRKDRKRLKELLRSEAYAHVEEETAEAIAVMASMPKFLEHMEDYKNEEGGDYSMCQAMDEIIAEAKEEGRAEMCQAMDEIIAEAKEEGLRQGLRIISAIKVQRREGKKDADIRKVIIKDFRLTVEEADGYMAV